MYATPLSRSNKKTRPIRNPEPLDLFPSGFKNIWTSKRYILITHQHMSMSDRCTSLMHYHALYAIKLVARKFDTKKGRNPNAKDIIFALGPAAGPNIVCRLWLVVPKAAHPKIDVFGDIYEFADSHRFRAGLPILRREVITKIHFTSLLPGQRTHALQTTMRSLVMN